MFMPPGAFPPRRYESATLAAYPLYIRPPIMTRRLHPPAAARQAPGQFQRSDARCVRIVWLRSNAIWPARWRPRAYGPPGLRSAVAMPLKPMANPMSAVRRATASAQATAVMAWRPRWPMDGQMGMGGPCQHCGGQGCENCRGGIFGHGRHGGDGCWLPNGLLGDVPGRCRSLSRWRLRRAALVRLCRRLHEHEARQHRPQRQVFASHGILGPIVLETDDLDFGSYRPGFRFSAAMQLAAANSLEFTYFGQFNYDASATVRSPNDNLFSVFSEFGTLRPSSMRLRRNRPLRLPADSTTSRSSTALRSTGGAAGWPPTAAIRARGPSACGTSSWTKSSATPPARRSTASSPPAIAAHRPARARFDIDTTNNLTGIQIGTRHLDLHAARPAAGGELQAGVYGNHMNVNTTIGVNTCAALDVPRTSSTPTTCRSSARPTCWPPIASTTSGPCAAAISSCSSKASPWPPRIQPRSAPVLQPPSTARRSSTTTATSSITAGTSASNIMW